MLQTKTNDKVIFVTLNEPFRKNNDPIVNIYM